MESDDRFATLTLDPESLSPPAGSATSVFAAWYKPTSSADERPYVHQPLGYPALPADVVKNLNGMCDHCGRFVRNQTFYVFRHLPTGGWVHVSAGCLEEYLGTPGVGDPVLAGTLISWCGSFDHLTDTIREAMPRQGREHFGVEEVVEAALVTIERGGAFISRGKARETGEVSTAAKVLDLLEFANEHLDDVTLIVGEQARAIVQWLREVHATEGGGVLLTDYLHNLSSVGTRQWVEARSVGLLCTAPAAYEAWKKQHAANSAVPVVDPGSYYGVLDTRVNADVFVDEIEERGENDFGVSLLVHMRVVPTGEKLSWWTGEGLKLETGKQYHVRMTPRKHAEWDGYRVTTVNRVTEAERPVPKEPKPEKVKGEKKPRTKRS